MHRIKCKSCGVTLKLKTIPKGKQRLKLKCPKCKEIFVVDLEKLQEKAAEPAPMPEPKETSKETQDVLKDILGESSQAPAPQAAESTGEAAEKDPFMPVGSVEEYYVIKANGKRIGPVSFSGLLNLTRQGRIMGIDNIECNGEAKPAGSYMEIKRILQERVLAQSSREKVSLGVSQSYTYRRQRRKTGLYILIFLFVVLCLVFLAIQIPKYLKSEAPKQAAVVTQQDDLAADAGAEQPEPKEAAAQPEKKKTLGQEIINFSPASIKSYLDGFASSADYRLPVRMVKRKQYSEAISALDDVLIKKGVSPVIIVLKLQTFLLWGELTRAEDDFLSMLSVAPGNEYLEMGYGAILTMKGDVERAKEYLSKARSKDPDNPFTAYYSAVLAFRRGDTDMARSYIDQAIRYAPDSATFVFKKDFQAFKRQLQ